jgi:predicted RNase H-like HicB family nuclease
MADILDLESSTAFGDTPEIALAEVKRAKTPWLAAAQDSGRPMPPLRYRPVISPAARKDNILRRKVSSG